MEKIIVVSILWFIFIIWLFIVELSSKKENKYSKYLEKKKEELKKGRK